MNFLIPISNIRRDAIESLADNGVVLVVQKPDGELFIPNGDFSDICRVELVVTPVREDTIPLFDPPEPSLSSVFVLPGGATLTAPRTKQRDSRVGAHLRSVLSAASQIGTHETAGRGRAMLLGGWELANASHHLIDTANFTASAFEAWSDRSKQDFANSASYMGSKRVLLPFLMQPMSDWLPESTVFVDLMCGSGCVAGAAATRWTTVASDAQSFCVTLAGIQSGGYSRSRAETVLDELQAPIQENFDWLAERLGDLLGLEESLLYSVSDFVSSAQRYSDFIADLPAYPRGGRHGMWDPVTEVEKRRGLPPFSEPSCLFTAYYADLYLGLRQAVEIDSIRHAISTLKDDTDRRWALGALLVATSKIATSYGGHFAQPKAPAERLTSERLFAWVAKWRSMSTLLEFEKRFLTLARESEDIPNTVILVPGPWQRSIDDIESLFPSRNIAAYLDAPYRRDEYSRYYHLLETLVQYSYPSASAWARIPDKGPERFPSEFSTRSRKVMAQRLAEVIDAILCRGWRCAWSYSEQADASMWDVLEALSTAPTRLQGISADHAYNWQGAHERRRSGPRLARELLVMMDP